VRGKLYAGKLETKRFRKAIASTPCYGWHAFHRRLATNLHELGIQDRKIQAILRHGSVAVTQAYYMKSLHAASIEAMQKLAQNFGQQMGTEKILVNA
jgi:integrase